MRKTVISVLRLLNGAMIVTSLLSLVTMVMPYLDIEPKYEHLPTFLHGLSILIPVTVTFVASRRCTSFAMFLLFAGLSLVPVFFLSPTVVEKIIFLLLSVAVIGVRIHGWYKGKEDLLSRPVLFVLVLFGFLYLVGTGTDNELMMNLNLYTLLAYTLLVIVHMNLDRLDEYLLVHQGITNVPTKRIGRINAWLLVFFMFLALMVIIFIPLTGLGNVLAVLGKLLGLLIIRLFMLIMGWIKPDTPTLEEEAEGIVSEMDGLPQSDNSPLWIRTVLIIAISVIFAIVVITILFFAIRALIDVIKRLYRPKSDENYELEFLGAAKDQKSAAREKARKDKPGFFDFSPNAVIRKQFRRTVERKKKVDSPSYTPDELLTFAKMPEDEKREVLHELYEKARYSEEGASKEDVARLKA